MHTNHRTIDYCYGLERTVRIGRCCVGTPAGWEIILVNSVDFGYPRLNFQTSVSDLGTRRSLWRINILKKVSGPLLSEIEFTVMLAYQKFDMNLSVWRSRRAKIVTSTIFCFILCHFWHFLALITSNSKVRRSTILEILADFSLPHRACIIMAQDRDLSIMLLFCSWVKSFWTSIKTPIITVWINRQEQQFLLPFLLK